MWQKEQADLLSEEIESLLIPLSEIAGFHHLVKEPLTKARRGLAVDIAQDHPWPLLPLIVCEAICGDYKRAVPAAAALQLLMAAGDVFDDIEDADSSESLSSKFGTALATNTATTLLILSEKALARLKKVDVEDNIIVRVIDTLNSYYTTACAGQYLDISLNSEKFVSEDSYLKITEKKSASQIECACYIGALLATLNQELIDIFAMFGHNLGMASQITNDIQGVIHGSDIINRRITLPIIYALTHTDDENHNQLEMIFSKQLESTPEPMRIKDILFRTGAIHYATVKVEFYKQRALDVLYKAKELGANIERLKLFLE